MLKKLLIVGAMLLSISAAGPAAAAVQVAVTTADLNLRAGPGTQYPVVETIPYGAGISVFGCVSGYSWCDIAWGANRGWVAAAYLQVIYRGAPVVIGPIIAPRIGVTVVNFDHEYWVRHYRSRSWYREWTIYRSR
jgi:uncharacterized protein YraI